MNEPMNSKKTKPHFEINWKIREHFSEAALTNFIDEIYNRYHQIEKKL